MLEGRAEWSISLHGPRKPLGLSVEGQVLAGHKRRWLSAHGAGQVHRSWPRSVGGAAAPAEACVLGRPTAWTQQQGEGQPCETRVHVLCRSATLATGRGSDLHFISLGVVLGCWAAVGSEDPDAHTQTPLHICHQARMSSGNTRPSVLCGNPGFPGEQPSPASRRQHPLGRLK